MPYDTNEPLTSAALDPRDLLIIVLCMEVAALQDLIEAGTDRLIIALG